MRISRILHNIDVGVEVQFTLLATNGVFVRLNTAVPEFTIVLRNRIFLSNGSQRVFNVPSTFVLKGVMIQFCPRQIFPIRSRKKTNNSISIARLVEFSGFQRRSSTSLPPELIFSTSFTNLLVREPREDCFLRFEKDIGFLGLIGFGLWTTLSYSW